MTIKQVDYRPKASHYYCKAILVFILCALFQGCSSPQTYAPVENAWKQPISKQGVHVVEKGETLYSIAWRYGIDYRDLASINYIQESYTIHPGQTIHLVGDARNKDASKNMVASKFITHDSKLAKNSKSQGTKSPVAGSKQKASEQQSVEKRLGPVKTWYWPVHGEIKDKFSISGDINKGINIASKYGTDVRSCAAGEVVYSGNGILGYGNLIIIKHNNDYLSAYAHNKANLVKEGTWVNAQQKIAEVGYSEDQQAILHFEIRKSGKPINPLKLLS